VGHFGIVEVMAVPDFNNPQNVPSTLLPKGARFLLVTELRKPPCDTKMWFAAWQDRYASPGIACDKEITYMTFAKLPFVLPDKPKAKIPELLPCVVPDGEEI